MPHTVLSKHDAPTASPGWWEQFSKAVQARPRAVEDRLFDEFIKDLKLFPTDPDRATTCRKLARMGAQALARPLLAILFLLPFGLALLNPAPAHAYAPISETHPVESTCHDRDELAGVTNAEAGAQPRDVQLRMMQVFVNEAESRGLSFCALSRLTNFSSVPAYARLHPDSYQAHQYAYPSEDLLLLASEVLHHRLPDVRAGAGHFDGDGMRIIFRP